MKKKFVVTGIVEIDADLIQLDESNVKNALAYAFAEWQSKRGKPREYGVNAASVEFVSCVEV